MERKVFIQSNNKQGLGAYLAKYAIERFFKGADKIPVEIIHVDELDVFKKFAHKEYLFNKTEKRIYNPDDLQSFTLTRFMPAERMDFSGKAVVIDPDIFALTNIAELFEKNMEGHSILACGKKSAWDSSVMLLDCKKLAHWKISEILDQLTQQKNDYTTIMSLLNEDVGELSRDWNDLDKLTPATKMLHTTQRLTQPWKTGLPIDFTRNKMPKLFGIIPREPIHKLLGRYPTHYQKHPDQSIEDFFFTLTKDALKDGAVTTDDIQKEIDSGHVRPDLLDKVA